MAEIDVYKLKLNPNGDTYNLPFLPLHGGDLSGVLTINGGGSVGLNVKRTTAFPCIGMYGGTGTPSIYGYYGFNGVDTPAFCKSDGNTIFSLLHTGNSSVSKSGETLTVKINDTSLSLTNTDTWRPLSNTYSSDNSNEADYAFGRRGAYSMYTALTNAINGKWTYDASTIAAVKVSNASYADSAGSAVDQTARNTATTAQTTANSKADISHKHTKSEITDFPTSLPANGGSATYTSYLGTSTSNYTKASLDTALGNKSDTSHTHTTFNASITVSGDITATAFYEGSDERLKQFKNSVNVDLDKLKSLRKSYFTFNNDPNKLHIGVSAQEIQKLYPEIVDKGEDGFLKVDYAKLSVIALVAVDKLDEKLSKLEERLNNLEASYGK